VEINQGEQEKSMVLKVPCGGSSID